MFNWSARWFRGGFWFRSMDTVSLDFRFRWRGRSRFRGNLSYRFLGKGWNGGRSHDVSDFGFIVGDGRFRGGLWSLRRLMGRLGRNRIGLGSIVSLDGLFLQETEDVIENKVSVWLFGEEEGLNEFAPGITVVGHFTDDLDDDAAIGGGLRVNGVNENLAILEADGSNLVVYFLLDGVKFSSDLKR